jgi:hypothetical protein
MKLKYLLLSPLFIAGVAFFSACHTLKQITPGSESLARERIMTAVLLRGDTVRFDADGARFRRSDSLIIGKTEAGVPDIVRADSSRVLLVERMNTPLTLLAVLGALLCISFAAMLIMLSARHPF